MDINCLVLFNHDFLQNLRDKTMTKVRVTRLSSCRFVRWISCQGVVLTVKCVLAYYGAPPPLLVFGRSTLNAQRTVQAKQTAGLISKMLRSVSKLRLSGHPGQPNSFEDSMPAKGVVRLRGAEPGCFTLEEPTMFS